MAILRLSRYSLLGQGRLQQRRWSAVLDVVYIEQVLQVCSANSDKRSIVHIIEKYVDSTALMLIGNPALPHHIHHRRVVCERTKALDVSRCLRGVGRFDLLGNRLWNVRHVAREAPDVSVRPTFQLFCFRFGFQRDDNVPKVVTSLKGRVAHPSVQSLSSEVDAVGAPLFAWFAKGGHLNCRG